MSNYNTPELNELEGMSPKQIAEQIFNASVKEPCSHQLLAYEEGGDTTFIFEILITILMEGINIFSGGLDSADLNNFSVEHITVLNPYFESFGFKINTTMHYIRDSSEYEEYYCKVVLRKLNKGFFIMKGIDEPYHFFINGTFLEKNRKKKRIDELYAVFINKDTVYRIAFDFITPNIDMPRAAHNINYRDTF